MFAELEQFTQSQSAEGNRLFRRMLYLLTWCSSDHYLVAARSGWSFRCHSRGLLFCHTGQRDL